MGLLNKILGEAMVQAESYGLSKKYTYEQALDVLLSPNPSAVELAKAENTMVMADKTTGSKAKRAVGVGLCKTYGLLTNAKTHDAQMNEAAGFLTDAAWISTEEEDGSAMEALKQAMASDYAQRIGLADCLLHYMLEVKEEEGSDCIYLACANMYGWGVPVNTPLARELLEEVALPGFKEQYHKGIYRLLAELDEIESA